MVGMENIMDTLILTNVLIIMAFCWLNEYTTGNTVCPRNGILIEGTCYWVTASIQIASDAHGLCVADGGGLAVVPNPTINAEIQNYKESLGDSSSDYYLGYHDYTNGGNLDIWTGGSQSWANWASGTFPQPNDPTEECVSMYGSFGYWWDEECDRNFLALCSGPGVVQETSPESTTITQEQETSPESTTITQEQETSLDTTTINPVTIATKEREATTVTSSNCNCQDTQAQNMTIEEIQEQMDKIKKELTVDKESLSSTVRKYSCAEDNRASAVTVGYLGGILLTIVFGGILLSDARIIFTALNKTFGCKSEMSHN